ncbi:hypothetical protein JOE31_000684 [Arthrobacter sp. PvP023]|uniref:hypothetical protein n=1 Tax=Micrococcaceae TaxID=1268 RepID=UPI001AEAC253|nr:hypothetical protein [Arthrobacter sp. PvP023]MBP1134452.1 hypothetical protein [Arthrobacter sp. PvP023]
MNQPLPAADGLYEVIRSVDGVTAVYPARPAWQNIAGAALGAATGVQLPPVLVLASAAAPGTTAEVRTRIGVSSAHRAPDVCREVAAAVRRHLEPLSVTVDVQVAAISGPQPTPR